MDVMKNVDLGSAYLEKEWVLSIQAPVTGMDGLLDAMRTQLELRQGHYECCLHVTGTGEQQFRALKGSHAGAEKSVQSVPVVEISISISPDQHTLRKTLEVIFEHHVHEEPTIRVTECWATQSRYTADLTDPNKYWNRPHAKEIHGTSLSHADKTS